MKKVLAIAVLMFFVFTSLAFAAKVVKKTNLLDQPIKTGKILSSIDANAVVEEVTGENQSNGYAKIATPDKKVGWVLISDTDINTTAPAK